MVQAISTGTFCEAKWVVDTTAGQGTHTTIASALTSASSGDTIFIRPGTYTENLTLKAGVNLSAFGSDSSLNNTGNVIISGKCTFTAAGTVTIYGIEFQTNSDYFLSVTGSSASGVNLINCYLNCSNNTGINFTSTDPGSIIRIFFSRGNLATTGISYFSNTTSAGFIDLEYCNFNNLGLSTTATSISAGTLIIRFCAFNFAISTSGTASLQIINSILDSATNLTPVTHNGTGTSCSLSNSRISSGNQPAISIGTGATLSISDCQVISSNANAITGAGTLQLGVITFLGSSSTINGTLTITSFPTEIGSLTLTTPLTVPNGGTGAATLTNHGVLVGSGTSAVTALSVGASNSVLQGSTGVNPSFTTTPQLTALGIGAAAGASGLTFDGTNLLANYAVGTFTPTLTGASTAGTTTYSTQAGYYVRIGSLVQIQAVVAGSAATGTGAANFGALPFTIKNQSSGTPYGSISTFQSGWAYPASTTSPAVTGVANTTVANVYCSGTGTVGGNLQMTNAAFNMQFTLVHEV